MLGLSLNFGIWIKDDRWLKAPFQKDGILVERTKGTPQGGVISPLLANIFLHYVFDKWMERNYPRIPFCRYADDGVVHCRTEEEALKMKEELEAPSYKCGILVRENIQKAARIISTLAVWCKTHGWMMGAG